MTQQHNAEFRRCLLTLDVTGIMRLWKHVAPHLADQSPAEALISLHIARCEAKYMPKKAKDYSVAWLADSGYQKIDGEWVSGLPKPKVIAESVGISSRNGAGVVTPFNKKIMTYMDDALQNARIKGINDPLVQRQAMLKAREKVRFKAGLI